MFLVMSFYPDNNIKGCIWLLSFHDPLSQLQGGRDTRGGHDPQSLVPGPAIMTLFGLKKNPCLTLIAQVYPNPQEFHNIKFIECTR